MGWTYLNMLISGLVCSSGGTFLFVLDASVSPANPTVLYIRGPQDPCSYLGLPVLLWEECQAHGSCGK